MVGHRSPEDPLTLDIAARNCALHVTILYGGNAGFLWGAQE